MNTKHTPGPWSLTEKENRIASGNTVIARIYAHTAEGQPSNVAPFTDEDIANAKLIAAAPCLKDFAALVVSQAHGDLSAEAFRNYIEREARKVLAQADDSWTE